MTEDVVDRKIRYEGSPAFASALVQMLTEQGVEVELWERPTEQRDLAGAAQEVVVNLVTHGTEIAIGMALAEFRRRFGKGGKADVEDDKPEDKDDSPSS